MLGLKRHFRSNYRLASMTEFASGEATIFVWTQKSLHLPSTSCFKAITVITVAGSCFLNRQLAGKASVLLWPRSVAR